MSARGRLPLWVWLQGTVRPAWLGTGRKDFVAAFYASTSERPLRARHGLRLACIRKFVFNLYLCRERHQRKPSCHNHTQPDKACWAGWQAGGWSTARLGWTKQGREEHAICASAGCMRRAVACSLAKRLIDKPDKSSASEIGSIKPTKSYHDNGRSLLKTSPPLRRRSLWCPRSSRRTADGRLRRLHEKQLQDIFVPNPTTREVRRTSGQPGRKEQASWCTAPHISCPFIKGSALESGPCAWGEGPCSCCFPFPENKKNLELPRANRDQQSQSPKGSFRFETNVLAGLCT